MEVILLSLCVWFGSIASPRPERLERIPLIPEGASPAKVRQVTERTRVIMERNETRSLGQR